MLSESQRAFLRQFAWFYLRYARPHLAEPLYRLLVSLDATDQQARLGLVYALLCQGKTEGVGADLARLRAVAETAEERATIERLEARRVEVMGRTAGESADSAPSALASSNLANTAPSV